METRYNSPHTTLRIAPSFSYVPSRLKYVTDDGSVFMFWADIIIQFGRITSRNAIPNRWTHS